MAPRVDNFSEDPFKRLKDRLRLYMKEQMIDDRILETVTDACKAFLRQENIVLSRTERNHLLRAVLREMVDDLMNEL